MLASLLIIAAALISNLENKNIASVIIITCKIKNKVIRRLFQIYFGDQNKNALTL